jgi:hypothetical protein
MRLRCVRHRLNEPTTLVLDAKGNLYGTTLGGSISLLGPLPIYVPPPGGE